MGRGTGKELLSLSGHSAAVGSVTWSPDGKRLATAGVDGIFEVYAMDFNDLMVLARERVTRNLTTDDAKSTSTSIDARPSLSCLGREYRAECFS